MISECQMSRFADEDLFVAHWRSMTERELFGCKPTPAIPISNSVHLLKDIKGGTRPMNTLQIAMGNSKGLNTTSGSTMDQGSETAMETPQD